MLIRVAKKASCSIQLKEIKYLAARMSIASVTQRQEQMKGS